MRETRYRIVRKLAEGGSGTTYLVWDVRTERKWVMKKVTLSVDQKREAAGREIRALREVRREGIPFLADVFYEDNNIYLIMEYMEGMTLEEKVRREGSMDQKKAVSYAMQLASLLCFFHERTPALIHGDIKPANLIVKAEKIALLDFGAAIFESYAGGIRSRVSNMPGSGWYTPGYGAPELYAGEPASIRSDIYAFGAVLFYMLTGEDADGSRGIYPIREQNRAFPVCLESLILKCTERNPEKRYASMREIISALKEKGVFRKNAGTRTFQVLQNVLLTEAKPV